MTAKKFYFYELTSLSLSYQMEIAENTCGVISVSNSKEICMVALPDQNQGNVRILNLSQDEPTVNKAIRAHDGKIQAL